MLSLFENSRSVRNVGSGEVQTHRDPRLQPMDAVEEQPADWYEDCIHAQACRAQAVRCGRWFEQDEESAYWMDRLASLLGCGEDCEEYDEANRIPMRKCGVMRDAT